MTTHTDDERVNGSRLRELREAKGLSSEQLARLCSLSVQQVLELENGGNQRFYSINIKINAARKVAQVLGVHESELLFEPIPVAEESLAETPSLQLQAEPVKMNHVEPPSSWAGYVIVFTVFLGAGAWWFQKDLPVSFPSLPVAERPSSLESEGSPVGVGAQIVPAAVDTQASISVPEVVAKEPDLQACNFDGEILILEAQVPNKPADKVSLMMHRQGELCVQDSTGKVWREDLKPWLGRNFLGTPPWRLTSPVLFYGDVYFQGEKMQIPSQKVHSITLNAKQSNP